MTEKLSGLLWFDNDPKKDWRQKVHDAADRYRQKTWLTANLCHISPEAVGLKLGLNDKVFVETVEDIEVYATSNTCPNNFWITHRPTQSSNHSAPQPPITMEQLSLLL